MPLYESYLDEDVDFDENFSEYLDDEQLGESDDFDEARSRRGSRRNRGSRRGGANRMASRNRLPSRNAPVNSGAIRNAFRGVGDDVTVLEKKLKGTLKAESNQNLLEALSILLAGAKPVFATLASPLESRNPDGSKGEVTQVVTGVNSNLLIPLAIKLFAGSRGSGPKNTQQLMIAALGILVLFPDLVKDLGLNLGSLSGSSSATGASNGTATRSNGTVAGVDSNLLLKGGLIYLLARNKN